MARPMDLTPKKYEVIKTRTGAEIMGMTRDTGNGLEITLPMICHLTAMPGNLSSRCTFFPYAPLSSDETVLFPYDHIAHRSAVNEQFIPLYDDASSSWFKMIENKSIPLEEKNDNFEQKVRDAMTRILRTENEFIEEELELLEEEEDISKKILH